MNQILLSFLDGAKVEIAGDRDLEYEVLFHDQDALRDVFRTKLRPGSWCQTNAKYFVNWRVTVEAGERIVDHQFNLAGKRALIPRTIVSESTATAVTRMTSRFPAASLNQA